MNAEKIHTIWDISKKKHKASLNKILYQGMPDTSHNQFFTITMGLIFWIISLLFGAIAIVLIPHPLAILFAVAAIVASPLVPLYWIWKLFIASLILFSQESSTYITNVLLCLSIIYLTKRIFG